MTRARDVSKIFTTPPTVYYTDDEALNNLMRYRFVATGGETTISGVDANGSTLSYVAGIEKVYLNGALLVRGYDYIATNGTSITSLSPALVNNDVIEIFSFNTFNVANTYTQSQVDGLISTAKVVQVVVGTTTTQANTASTTYQDTGLTATITPTSASNKILVLVSQNGVSKTSNNSSNGVWLRLLRDGSQISLIGAYLGFNGTATNMTLSASTGYLDTPATTSAVTYKTQYKNNVAAADVYVQDGNTLSSIILMEVKP